MKRYFLLLVLAVLWLAAAAIFFILHFAGTGMIPLYMPILLLAVSAACFFGFFCLRRLSADMKRKK